MLAFYIAYANPIALKYSLQLRLRLGLTIVVFIVSTSALVSQFGSHHFVQISRADSINTGVFGPDTEPYGLPFDEWVVEWWNWLVGIPQDINPADDKTGEHCSVNQDNPNVWFLTGAFSGTVERTCTIPAGRGIPIVIAGSECSFAEYRAIKTEEDLRSCAIPGNQPKILEVTVDNVELKNLQNYIVVTPLFNLTIPENNLFGVQPGLTQAVAHSYLIFLEPLKPGNHTISFKTSYFGPDEPEPNSYDVKYKIITPYPSE
jgi:hypothetical protein